MVSLEDTELSCVAGLPQKEGGGISGCFRFSFSLLQHECNSLLKVPVLSVNSCPALQLHPAASTVSTSVVFRFLGDPGRQAETESSEVEDWLLPYFSCSWCLCLVGISPAWSGSDQLSFLFWNGKVKP